MSALDKLTLEQLDGGQREIAELIGMEAYKRLVKNYGGGSVYIRLEDELVRDIRNAEIAQKFDGRNYRELAAEYKLTEVTHRKIISDNQESLRQSLRTPTFFDLMKYE